jgi:Uma2 family endonuclease
LTAKQAPRYARGGVAELWLIDLERDVVVAYRDPAGEAYQHVQVFHRGETITITALPGPRVPVEAILG